MLNFFKNKRLWEYGCWTGVMIAAVFLSLSHILQDKYPFPGIRPWVAAASVVYILVFAVLIHRHRKNIAAVFLISYLLLGVVYFVAIPLLRAPDEPSHFLRAYEISHGYMLSDMDAQGHGGRTFSYNLYPANIGLDQVNVTQYDIWERYGEEKLSEREEFLIFWNTSLYAPVSYLPQALGIGIMRLFTDRIVWIGYAGRLVSFLIVGLLGFLAVRYVPVGKKVMCLLLLFPMNMQEAVSLAPDAMVTVLTCALISFVLYMRLEYTEKMKLHHYAMLYALCIAVGLYKIVYLPFCLFPFLIPQERFGGRKLYIRHALALGFLVVVSSLGWLSAAGAYLSDTWGADGDAQVRFILTQPFQYVKVLWNTMRLEGSNYLHNIIGADFGWLTIHVPKILVKLYAVLCLLVVLVCGEKVKANFLPVRAVSAFVVICVFILTFTSIYVQWNLPQAETVLGIQGRYFIPLIFPVWLALQGLLPEKWTVHLQPEKLREHIPAVMVLLVGIQLCMFSDIFTQTIGEYGGGWRNEANGRRYWISEEEYLQEEWYRWKGDWYYFGADGYMLTDTWIEGADGVYYVSENGAMLAGTTAPDGSVLDEDGRKIE